MKTERTLNDYLRRLEKTLGPISVADKAEIILEIKSHIEEAQTSGTPLKDVLSSLGEPETVANRYLLERGLRVQRAPRHPILKWLTIGFLGSVGMVILAVLVLVWKFSPIV